MFAAIPMAPPVRKTTKELIEERCSHSYEHLVAIRDTLETSNLSLLDPRQQEMASIMLVGIDDIILKVAP